MTRLPDVMRVRRAELRWTQRDLANAAGIGLRQVARYEAGEQEPTLARAAALAEALDLTLDQLAGREALHL